MRTALLVLTLLLAAPVALSGAHAIQACPHRPCVEPGGDDISGPVNYFFGVTIKQDLPNTVPTIQGTLMSGCSFTAVTNQGTVTCSPPVAPAPNTHWTCDSAGLVVTANTGTVTGVTQCNGGPAVTATASNPGTSWQWNIAIGTWGFPWTCSADFTSPLATGTVLCDEPDPPVQFW